MKALWLAVFLALPASAQSAPTIAHIRVDSVMLRHLEQIAETAHVETARCIMGRMVADTVLLAAAADTPWLIAKQTDSSVAWRWWNCPGGTLALWHTHLWRRAQHAPVTSPDCWISRPDLTILSVPGSPPVSIVSIKPGTSCLFVRLPDGSLARVGDPN